MTILPKKAFPTLYVQKCAFERYGSRAWFTRHPTMRHIHISVQASSIDNTSKNSIYYSTSHSRALLFIFRFFLYNFIRVFFGVCLIVFMLVDTLTRLLQKKMLFFFVFLYSTENCFVLKTCVQCCCVFFNYFTVCGIFLHRTYQICVYFVDGTGGAVASELQKKNYIAYVNDGELTGIEYPLHPIKLNVMFSYFDYFFSTFLLLLLLFSVFSVAAIRS